jgi:hypothetical protein
MKNTNIFQFINRRLFFKSFSLLVVMVSFFIVSCQKDLKNEPIAPVGNVVSLESATKIATNYFSMYYEKEANRDIEEYQVVAENDKPYYYIFNFKQGGFLILSADYGDVPILADGLTEKFPLKGQINPGLGMWLMDTRDRIVNIREKHIEASSLTSQMWKSLENNTFKTTFKAVSQRDFANATLRKKFEDDPDCSLYTTTQVTPLLSTVWDQGCGYNALCPTIAGGPCGHALTGCVATSMAQVARFFQFPSTYNYSSMSNFSGNNDVATLMHDCGVNVSMTYGADASGAEPSNIKGALQQMGYSSAICRDSYDEQTCWTDIAAGKPVILDGFLDYSCFLWWCWPTVGGHSWVADGFITIENPCFGTNRRIHMNWGWGGEGPNDYYYYPKPANLNLNFQYFRDMIHNIQP